MNINKTELKDLKNIELLWNNGQVMKYVGYPEGINTNQTKLNEWFSSIESSNDRAHYSIYQYNYYLGELFYNAEKEDHIIIDIKLMPSAWGKGIATYALSFLLDTIFDLYPQGVCFVDPHEDNVSAKRLYKALGFKDNRLSWKSFKPSKRYLNDTITLKRMVQSDMERLWELSSKDAYYEYAQYNAPYFNEFRQRTYPEFIEESSSFYLSNPRVQGIYYHGRLIGSVSYYWESEVTRWLEMGIVLYDPLYWSKGIGECVIRSSMDDLFETLEIERVGFTTWSGNLGMMRIGHKLGMRQEKAVRKARYYKDTYYDSIGYGITREEWNSLYKSPFDYLEVYEESLRSTICSDILNELPDWFGRPESNEAYIEAVKSMRMIAVKDNDEVVGFLALKSVSADTFEIEVMGIKPTHQCKGIGRTLIQRAMIESPSNLMVRTLGESHPDPYYRQTRSFYLSCGFTQLYIDEVVWGEGTPCLILVKSQIV